MHFMLAFIRAEDVRFVTVVSGADSMVENECKRELFQ